MTTANLSGTAPEAVRNLTEGLDALLHAGDGLRVDYERVEKAKTLDHRERRERYRAEAWASRRGLRKAVNAAQRMVPGVAPHLATVLGGPPSLWTTELLQDLARLDGQLISEGIGDLSAYIEHLHPLLDAIQRRYFFLYNTDYSMSGTDKLPPESVAEAARPANSEPAGGGLCGSATKAVDESKTTASDGDATASTPRKLITVAAAGYRNGVSKTTLYRAKRKGELKDFRDKDCSTNAPLKFDVEEIDLRWPPLDRVTR